MARWGDHLPIGGASHSGLQGWACVDARNRFSFSVRIDATPRHPARAQHARVEPALDRSTRTGSRRCTRVSVGPCASSQSVQGRDVSNAAPLRKSAVHARLLLLGVSVGHAR
jgi:hypothetical protein